MSKLKPFNSNKGWIELSQLHKNSPAISRNLARIFTCTYHKPYHQKYEVESDSLMAFCFELWSVFGCNHKAIHNFESGCNFLRLFSSFTESEGTDFSEIEQNTRDDLQVCKRLCSIGNYLDAMLVWCPKNFGKPITLSKLWGDMVHPLAFLFWLSGLYLSGELGKPSSKYFQRRFSVATTFLKLKLKNLHPWISL